MFNKEKNCCLLLLSIILCMTLVAACATGGLTRAWEQWMPKERALYMMSIYNAQDLDYRNVAARKDSLNDDQIALLRQKKIILTKLYALINIYVLMVNSEGSADQESEQVIIDLLNKLQNLNI